VNVVVPSPSGTSDEYQPIRDAGHEVIFGRDYGDRRAYGEEELLDLTHDADLIISASVSRRLMESAPNLRAVIGPAIGYERIDVKAATDLSIVACNSPSWENFTGVSEAAVGLMLALGKRLKHKEAILRDGGWGTDADRGFLLTGKTVAIVGLGRTGSGVARRLQGWGCHLAAYDPYVSRETAAELGVELVDDLSDLLQAADYLTLHVVITEETTNMIGAAELRQMKPAAYLINTSRGRALDEDALCEAIDGGWIAGAALDVYWQEPLPLDIPLRRLDPIRVILTSHNVAASPDSRAGNLRLALQSTLEVLAGNVPEYTVNPEVVPAWRQRFKL
jgi:D-3-phosphoglycerate dehydrogenase